MFVIYHKDTTRTHMNRRSRREYWETERSAKAERTRSKLDTDVWLIADGVTFREDIEKTEVVYSIHDTKKERPITQSVNTPRSCDPSSELYWSM